MGGSMGEYREFGGVWMVGELGNFWKLGQVWGKYGKSGEVLGCGREVWEDVLGVWEVYWGGGRCGEVWG